MPKADNKLSGARSLGILDASSLGQTDKFTPKDTETLYRFSLNKSSRFDSTLSRLVKKANADVELYRFKNSAEQVLGAMGRDNFSVVPSATRDANLQLLATSKRRGNRNEKLAIANLDAGEYVVRVFRKTGRSQYSLKMAATAIAPPLPESTLTPTADLNAANLDVVGGNTYDFTVAYSDNRAINTASLDSNDIQVTGPNGFSQLATLVSVNDVSNGTPRTVTYRITAPGGTWDDADSGTYSVAMQGNQVSDTDGNFVGAAPLGSFLANIPLPRRSLRASGSSNGSIEGYAFTINTNVKPKDNVFSKALEGFQFTNLVSPRRGTIVAKNINLGSSDIISLLFNVNGESGVDYTANFSDYRGTLLDGQPFTLSSNRLVFHVVTSEPNAVNSLLPLESFLNNLASTEGLPSPDLSLFANARDVNGNDLNDSLQIINPSLLTVNSTPAG
jgi:hypothetical protein